MVETRAKLPKFDEKNSMGRPNRSPPHAVAKWRANLKPPFRNQYRKLLHTLSCQKYTVTAVAKLKPTKQITTSQPSGISSTS